MTTVQLELPLAVELSAAGLGGVQGALFAATQREHRIDVLGVVGIGLATALGGSLLRDVVLDRPPVVVWADSYLLVAAAGAVLGMLVQPALARATWPITVLDALVMGLFGAVGASKALALGVGVVGSLAVGVLGAIGGGVLRDLALSRPVSVLQVGTLYAVAAALGAGSLVLLLELGSSVAVAGAFGVAVTAVTRVAAVGRGWTFPEQPARRA